MLVIRIEIWPFGFEDRKRLLAEGRIINDGSGTLSKGNYRVELRDEAGRLWKKGTVSNFPRKRLLAWDLLARALHAILGERNGLQAPPEKRSDSATG